MATTPTVVGLPHVSSDPYTRNNEVVKLVPSGYEVTKALGGPPASPTSTAPLSEASDSRPPSPKALVLGANVTPSGVEATAPAPGSEGCGCGVGNKEMVGATSAEVPSCKQPAIRVRKIYGRLPKFSPFVGNFQHAPSAGNRSRSSFFERHLISEEDHERQQRIKTNPYTGTFHFFPGRYSTLHGLQRFRHGSHHHLHSSFDELDRLADMSRRVTERVRKADNPSLAAVFMNGVFSSSSAVYARVSVFPVRSCVFTQLQPEGMQTGGQRYRYGGAVDMYRKFGTSLDDGCLKNKAASAYRDILYRWNGFRLHHMKKYQEIQQERQSRLHHYRSRSSSQERLNASLMSSTSLGMSLRMNSLNTTGRGGGPMSPPGVEHSVSLDQTFSRRGRSPVRKLVLARNGTFNGTGTFNASGTGTFNANGTGSFNSNGTFNTTSNAMSATSTAPLAGLEEEEGGRQGKIRRTSQTRQQQSTHYAPQQLRVHSPPTTAANQLMPDLMSTRSNGSSSPTAIGKPLVVQRRKITDTYDVHKELVLGEGSFAAVYVAHHRDTKEEYAVKAIKKRYLFTEEEKASVANEIHNMFRVARHRNIIRLYETFETAEHVYLVLEKSTHGNLEQILQLRRKVTELEAMWVVKQLLDAVEYLHACGVLHCDIKPHNILFSDVEGSFRDVKGSGVGGAGAGAGKRLWMYTSPLGMVLKLCDFGLSRKVPDVRYYKHTGDINKVPFSRITGTTGFIAPEMMQKKPYGKPADMWSVGVVLSKMLSGSMPFSPPQRCLESDVSFRGRVWDVISDGAKAFVRGLLENDQCRRLTAKQALAERWLQTVPEWGPQLMKCGPAVPLPKPRLELHHNRRSTEGVTPMDLSTSHDAGPPDTGRITERNTGRVAVPMGIGR